MDRAQHRIAWMLGVSALLHVWFMYTAPQPGAPRAAAATGAPITATLSQPQINGDGPAPQAAPNPLPQTVPNSAPSLKPLVTHHPATKQSTAEGAVELPATPKSSDSTADATYYAARDLDVFPKAITVLELGLRAGATGKVRATVLIDESGTVNEVRAIDASVADIERAARDLLLRARFTPASKDGRLVKAQLLVSLDYGLPPP
jgi:hypothetical protein